MKILHIIPSCRIGNGAAKLILDMIPLQMVDDVHIDIAILQETPNSYIDSFKDLGCTVYTFSAAGKTLYNPCFIFKIKHIAKNYNIVHMHLFPAFYFAVIAKSIFNLKCKLVFTEHSTLNNRQKWYLRGVERFIYNRIDKVVAISEAARDCLIRHLRKDLDVCIVANGIHIDNYSSPVPIDKKSINVPESSILLTQVARFAPQKDQMTVLRAMANLPERYHVAFVGQGSLMDKHKEEAKLLNINDRVHFLGVRKDVPAILKASDIVVMSSNFEGFGLAALEGMAAGKPVIASDVPGVAEVVSGAGLLFQLQNAEDLLHNIMSLENPDIYSSVQKKCEQRARSYSIEETANKYMELYNSIS